jgi:hypothetical protein
LDVALLNRPPALVSLAGLLAVLAGCALIESLSRGERRFAFSHRTHVVGERLACVSCHESFAMSDDPGMPSLDGCGACHDDIDEEKPEERRVATLFEDDAFRAAHASRLDGEVLFSHKLHARDPESCGACHRGIEESERIDESIGVAMARCTDCHRERAVANDCETCHAEIRATWAPPSHAHDWERFHGRVVRAKGAATAHDCSLCHTESTCVACHKDEPPASHDNFFRMRGHGLVSRMDRSGCAVCHAPDSCEQCHAETLPLSHMGNWGGTRSAHCLGCHFPLQSEGCSVCHEATPSHLLGAPKPPWHTPAMNCRQCHGVSAPLPHFDKGDDCNACHL